MAIRAFGPFADSVEIDFDEVAQAGIFLIHGATGSGKTSLLDAVCVALYGRAPGLRPANQTWRSDHASAEAIPEVSLEFTAAGHRLRVTRMLEHSRPKRGGSGVRVVRGQGRLEECALDGTWTVVSTRAEEIGDALGQALGMGLDQFAKVVLLPQGDFAAFLRASPEDRRALLERLFDVSRFTDVERWLAERRRETAAAATAARATLAADLVRVADVLARLPRGESEHPLTLPDSAGALPGASVAAVREQVHALALAALSSHESAEGQALAAERAVTAAVVQARARQRGELARQSLAAYTAELPRRSAAEERANLGERAGRLAGDIRALRAAEAHQRAATQLLLEAQSALATLCPDALVGPEHSADVAPGDQVRDLLARAHRFEGVLSDLDRINNSLAASEGRRRALADNVTAGQGRLSELDAQEVALLAERRALLTRAEHLRTLAAQIGEADASATHLSQLRSLREQDVRTTDSLASAEKAALAANRVALAQAARLLDLRQRRLDGMAGELAERLIPGQDCPVCGSKDHPQPANRADVVTAQEVEAAQVAWEPLDARARALDLEVASAQATLAGLRHALAGDDRCLEELAAAGQLAIQRLENARAAARELEPVMNRIAQIDTGCSELASVKDGVLQRVAAAQAIIAELDEVAANDATQAREARERHTLGCPCSAGDRSGPALRQHHHQVVLALSDVAERASDARSAQEQWRHQAASTALAAQGEGFDDVASAEAATLPTEEVAAIRAALAREDESARTAREVLADAEVVSALAAPPPNQRQAEATLLQARTRRVAAARAHALAEQAARDLDGLARAVSASAHAAQDCEQRAHSTAALADLVAGLGADNTLRMKLSAYVLAGRLERVVDLANERLVRMGEGRFRLAHTDRLAGSGRRSGLGLLVEDTWTGQSRDTATLSGGESFMASLALALGLADAVREESGGTDLHTLFIDEGFGSLDAESLEQVMAVLDHLQDGGRAVGLVSHVPGLRDRIPAQIRVDKTRIGSTVRRVTGPAA